jgi:ribosomal protein S18 acetylase RimI-like enzyme
MAARDIVQVAAIGNAASELQASATDVFWSQEILERWAQSDDITLVAEADGVVVGFQLTQLHEPTRAGYLSDIAVHLDWRRRGIGKLLIEGALDRMRARGAEYVYGLTKLENEKIHTLLEKHDFTRGNAFYWFEKHI